jgi:hypothetical protein
MINPDNGNWIKMVSQDAGTGEPVARGEPLKDTSSNLNDEDFESVKVESSAIILRGMAAPD